MTQDPIALFSAWLAEAKATPAISEPTAMCLATATAEGSPSARMVLLKEHDARGFVFYTNLESRKSHNIAENPKVALCFYWMALTRQVRIEGVAAPVSAQEADAYYASRPRESRIGAWASQQSRPLGSRGELLKAVAAETLRHGIGDIPRPPFWSGWRVTPSYFEFWEQGDFRLHDRLTFTRNAEGGWDTGRLYP